VATERAFIMIAVMLGAVLLDRRALTLRSVAVAALVLLLFLPESLLDPGFQMSFAATIALIVGLCVPGRQHLSRNGCRAGLMPVFTLVLSSLIGGLATAPYAAAHFNRFTDYGLIANLLTVPVMGVVIMPAGALAALLAPIGLAGPPLVGDGAGRALDPVRRCTGSRGLRGRSHRSPPPGPGCCPCSRWGRCG
jgi:competence protein ComEC